MNQTAYLGVVSPCSSCKNQRAIADPISNLPACPRRAAAQESIILQKAGQDTTQLDLLVLSGNEDQDSSTPNLTNQLVNPVYSDSYNSALVWVALLKNNTGIYASDGSTTCPDILDSGFDTNYIFCHSYPVTPIAQESEYRSQGAWAENDLVQITLTSNQQNVPSSSGAGYNPLLADGFAKKVNFPMSNPRSKADRDYSVPGI